jgi:hypothetical protein
VSELRKQIEKSGYLNTRRKQESQLQWKKDKETELTLQSDWKEENCAGK